MGNVRLCRPFKDIRDQDTLFMSVRSRSKVIRIPYSALITFNFLSLLRPDGWRSLDILSCMVIFKFSILKCWSGMNVHHYQCIPSMISKSTLGIFANLLWQFNSNGNFGEERSLSHEFEPKMSRFRSEHADHCSAYTRFCIMNYMKLIYQHLYMPQYF